MKISLKIKFWFAKIFEFIIIALLKFTKAKLYTFYSYGLIFHVICIEKDKEIIFKRIEEIDEIKLRNQYYYDGLIKTQELEIIARLKKLEEELDMVK
jgi:hypothetical protein